MRSSGRSVLRDSDANSLHSVAPRPSSFIDDDDDDDDCDYDDDDDDVGAVEVQAEAVAVAAAAASGSGSGRVWRCCAVILSRLLDREPSRGGR